MSRRRTSDEGTPRALLLAALAFMAAIPTLADPSPAPGSERREKIASSAAPPRNDSYSERVVIRQTPPRPTIGDVVTLRAYVLFPAGSIRKVAFPKLGRTWGEAEISTANARFMAPPDVPKEIQAEPGEAAALFEIGVTLFEPGTYILHPLDVTLVQADGARRTLATRRLPLRIAAVIPPSQRQLEIKDVKAPRPLPLGAPFWILLAVALAAFGWALAALLAARRRAALAAAAATPEIPAVPPLAEALALFDAILGRSLADFEACRIAHFDLSQGLRRYLTRRLRMPALDFTTTELGRELSRRFSGERWGGEAKALLRGADGIKFGRYPSARAEVERAVTMARELATRIEDKVTATEEEERRAAAAVESVRQRAS